MYVCLCLCLCVGTGNCKGRVGVRALDNFDSSHLAEACALGEFSFLVSSFFFGCIVFCIVFCCCLTSKRCRKCEEGEEETLQKKGGVKGLLSVRVLKTFVGGQFYALGLFI